MFFLRQQGVPTSDRFVFGAGSSSTAAGGPEVIVTSSNSGLAGQEALDRTAVELSQFAAGEGRTVPSTPQTTSPQQVVKERKGSLG